MRKAYIAVFFALFLFILSSCSENSIVSNETSIPAVDTLSPVCSELKAILPFECDVISTEADGKVNVSIFEVCEELDRDAIDKMGYGIFIAKEYCDSSFSDYDLSVTIFDSSRSSIMLLWKSSFSEFGTMIDNRSGEAAVTVFEHAEDMLSFFPKLTSRINSSKLDLHDLEIYSEVMSELDLRPMDSEETIFKELAPKYGMTHQQLKIFVLDVMEKVNSRSGEFDPVTPVAYPSLTESPFLGSFQTPPDIVYSTTASENGLAGSFYSVIGTVREHSSIESAGTDLNFFIMDTEHGPVLFADLYSLNISLNQESDESLVEKGSDYTFPPVGSYVKVYGVYRGFSTKLKMPMFIYGIPKWIE